MDLLIVIGAFVAGLGSGLLVPHRVLDASFKWAAWVLGVGVALSLLIMVINLFSQGLGSLLPDAEACRVDGEGILVDPDACTEGHNVWGELYGLTVIGALLALVAGILAGMRISTARAGKRRRAADSIGP